MIQQGTPSLGAAAKTAPPSPVAPAPSPNQAAAQTAAKTQSSLDQYLNYLKTDMGRINPTQIENQAQSELNAETSPLIKGYTAQANTGNQQIVGLTQTYAQQLAGIGAQASADYTTAEGQQAALDAASAQALGGNVGAAASQLQASLAAAGQNTSVASQASADAASTAGAAYVSGSAGLSSLFAQGAAQNAYNATLPGLAKLSGLQAIGTYDAGLSQAEASAVQEAQEKLPTVISTLTSAAEKQQSNVISAGNDAARIGISQQSANASTARAEGELAADQSKENQPKTYGNSSTGYFALVPDGKGGYSNTQLTAPGAKTPKTFGSASAGYYSIDPTTGAVKQLTNPVVKPTKPAALKTVKVGNQTYLVNPTTGKPVEQFTAPAKAGAKSGLTPHETDEATGDALTIMQNAYNGVPSKNLPPISYNQAILEAEQSGVPRAVAVKAANRWYKAGARGRPVSNKYFVTKPK